MAKCHSRPIHFKCNSRFQNLFSLQTSSVGYSPGIRSKLNYQGRNFVSTKKGSNKTGSFQPRWILPSTVSCSEKRRRSETSFRSKCVKPVYRNRTFQNGEFDYFEVSSKQGGLYDKLRPHGCLPDGSHASRLSKISSFSVRGQNLPVYSNAIRPESGPQALHKNHEAGCSLTTESGGPFKNISGRHFDHSFVNRNIKSPQNAGHRLAGISRVPNQLQEVKSNSIPADCFLGDAGRFGFHAVHSTSSKICTHSERMSPLTEHAQSNGSTVVSGIRTSRILSPGRMVRPTSLSSNTNPSDQSSSEVVKLQYTGRFDTSNLVPRVFALGKRNTLVWADDVTYIIYATKWGWVVFSCTFMQVNI